MNELTFQQLKRLYYNRCVPEEVLEPGDHRYAKLDDFGEGNHTPRGRNWVEQIAERVELADKHEVFFFTGLPGSGKSTELKRLIQRLEREDSAHLFPVYIDALDAIDLNNEIDVSDIVANVVHGADVDLLVEELRGKFKPKSPGTFESELRAEAQKRASADGYSSRLLHWLSSTEVEAKQLGVSLFAGFSVTLEMKNQESFRQNVRRKATRNFQSFIELARKELESMQERAKKLGFNGLFIVFDSLEKLRGLSGNWQRVLSSAEQVFGGNAPHLQLPAHVLYTLPPAQAFRMPTAGVHFMPMIKLRERSGEDCAVGILAARELVRLRIPDHALTRLLGDGAEGHILELIRWSGGYPRELIRMLRTLITEARPDQPLSDVQLQRIGQEMDDGYRQVVTRQSFAWLAQVAITNDLILEDDQHREAIDFMFTNNVVLRYSNAEVWYDIHPSLYKLNGVQEAIQQLNSDSQGESAPSTP